MAEPNFTRSFSAFELEPGRTYRVTHEFVDYDGITHQIGETWTYIRKDFLPYEDGLTLYTEKNGSSFIIRLQGYPEAQGPVVNAFSDYVEVML